MYNVNKTSPFPGIYLCTRPTYQQKTDRILICPATPYVRDYHGVPNISCFQWHIRLVDPRKCRSLLSKADKR